MLTALVLPLTLSRPVKGLRVIWVQSFFEVLNERVLKYQL